MLNRQKVTLTLIKELEKMNIHSRRAIVKSLFLLKEEYSLDNQINFYSFYPYKQGPFSQMCYADLRKLHSEELIDSNKTSLTETGVQFTSKISNNFTIQINQLLNRFKTENEITSYVYEKYPKFTINSELIPGEKIKSDNNGIVTIGYEGKNIDKFLNILIENDVDILIDVRRNAFSMNFQYIKNKLKDYLESVNIQYMHVPELGIESDKKKT